MFDLNEGPTNFALVRIIGNDLYPRNSLGRSIENLRYIVENEYPFENCDKFYIVNKVVSPEHEEEIISYLEATGSAYLNRPIDRKEYNELSTLEQKRAYLFDINKARNFCLDLFGKTHNVVLPMDGHSFFRLDGWFRLVSSIEEGKGYSIIQTARCVESYPDIQAAGIPSWFEVYRHGGKTHHSSSEPQLAFITEDFDIRYDENLDYSELSKIDLLWRLGFRGVWDGFYPVLYAKSLLKGKSKFFGRVCHGGWCYRLPSGVPNAEKDNQLRAELKNQAIRGLIEHADRIYSN